MGANLQVLEKPGRRKKLKSVVKPPEVGEENTLTVYPGYVTVDRYVSKLGSRFFVPKRKSYRK